MKANELMIGDWLYIEDANTKEKYYCRVKKIGTQFIFFDCDEVDVDGLSYDCCFPVPLTPEILEKNGFYVKREFNGDVIEETCLLDKRSWISFTMAGFYTGWICEWARIGCRLRIYKIDGENEFRGTAKYVHELQNALKLCGIEEEIKL